MEHITNSNLVYTDCLTKKDLIQYLFARGVKKAITRKAIEELNNLNYTNNSFTHNGTLYVICKNDFSRRKYYAMFKPGIDRIA